MRMSTTYKLRRRYVIINVKLEIPVGLRLPLEIFREFVWRVFCRLVERMSRGVQYMYVKGMMHHDQNREEQKT